MENYFKKELLFRNNGKQYLAKFVDLGEQNNEGYLGYSNMALIYIYEDHKDDPFGLIYFKKSNRLNYVLSDKSEREFPFHDYVEESLVNLLHYLPLYPELLNKLINNDNKAFAYQFVSDLKEGLDNNQIFNIKTEKSIFKTFKQIIFQNDLSPARIKQVLLEPLYILRLKGVTTSMPWNELRGIIPLNEDLIKSNLDLYDGELVEINKDAGESFVSIKITSKGFFEVENGNPSNVQSSKVNYNFNFGNQFGVSTGDNSPVSISDNDIDNVFNKLKNEVEENGDDCECQKTISAVKESPETAIEINAEIRSHIRDC